MPWLQRLVGHLRKFDLLEMANDIAVSKQSLVMDRVGQRLFAMRPAEARGYIRARASGIVQAEVDRIFSQQRQLRPSLRPHLVEHVYAQLVDQAMVEFHARQKVAASKRKAA